MNNPVMNLPIVKKLNELGPQFTEMARSHNLVNFKEEVTYACGILENNAYLLKVAEQNPESIRQAVLNIAGTGITLNPVHQHAYLVPRTINRKSSICLDISYKGLMHMALESGALEWVHADVVKEADEFEMKELGEKPLHKLQPFKKDRGDVVGAYCVAKLHNGDYMTVTMDIDEIHEIRACSESYKSKNNSHSPWVKYYEEMVKKTVVKRAYKFWPKVDVRFKKAIEVINEHEGINFENEKDHPTFKPIDYERRYEQVDKIKELLGNLCHGFNAGEKIAFMVEHTGFNKFADIEIQDNEALAKIELKLLTLKTAKELDVDPSTLEAENEAIEAEVIQKEMKKEDRKDAMFEANGGESIAPEETELSKMAKEMREGLNSPELSTEKRSAKDHRFTLEA